MPLRSSKKKLIKKLQWTFQVEGMNSVMFFGILIFLNATYKVSDLLFLSYGLLLMCFVLFQGTYYWWVKYSALKDEHIFQARTLSRFQDFKKLNRIIIALIPVVILLQWFVSGKQITGDNFLGWALFANGFGVLEYINYYHKQLMYDNKQDLKYLIQNRKLKEASLHKDLREQKI